MNGSAESTKLKVWDPLVRVGHWLLVAGFFVAYLTEDESLDLHVWAGYLVGSIVLVRVVWGFIGPPHARFSDFVYTPAAVLAYLRDLLRGGGPRYLGHSPAGGAMVLMLLASLTVITYSGLMVYAYEEGAGPMAGFVAQAETRSEPSSLPRLIQTAVADDDEHDADERKERRGKRAADRVREKKEDREDFWEELHELSANFTLFLVLLHVAGVTLASFVHRENLVKAMVTGRKRAADEPDAARDTTPRRA